MIGRIVHFDLTDAVGRVRLESGEELRFGASACDFPPATGIEVEVLASTAHPRGPKATRLRALSQPNVDAAVALRDGVHAWQPWGTQHVAKILEQMAEVGLVTLVFDRRLDDHAALRSLFDEVGVKGLAFEPEPMLTLGENRLKLAVVDAPLDTRSLDASLVGSAALLGQSIVSLVPGPFVFRAVARQLVRLPGKTFDAWTGWGLEHVHRAVDAFMAAAVGYVMHKSGTTILPPTAWRGWAATPSPRPVLPWVGLVEDASSLQTRGMEVWALPDVQLRTTDPTSRASARYVALNLCHEMAGSATMPASRGLLTPHPDVPVRWRIERADVTLVVAAPD
jgi:hypothetical protein